MIQQTSLAAYDELKKSRQLGPRQKAALAELERHPDGITDRELKEELHWEINQITGRRNELVYAGLVCEKSHRFCRVTRRRVIAWGIRLSNEQQMRIWD